MFGAGARGKRRGRCRRYGRGDGCVQASGALPRTSRACPRDRPMLPGLPHAVPCGPVPGRSCMRPARPWLADPSTRGGYARRHLPAFTRRLLSAGPLAFHRYRMTGPCRKEHQADDFQLAYRPPRPYPHRPAGATSPAIPTRRCRSSTLASRPTPSSAPRWSASTPAAAGPKGRCGSATGATCCGATSPTTGCSSGKKRPGRLACTASPAITPTATPGTAPGGW